MKRLNYTKMIYWLFGMAVAIVAGLSLVLSFLDWNQYRTPLAEFASRQMGMRVELVGDVSLALFPRPLVSAEAVRLSPATDVYSEVVATADRIGVHLGVGSLLKGKFSLQSMRLDGLDIVLEETPTGQWRVRGWPESETAQGPDFEVLRFRLANSRATLVPFGRDAIAIEGVSLFLDGALSTGPLTWEGEFTTAGQTIVSSGRVRPVSVRDELSVKADFALADTNLSLSGRLLPKGDMTGRLELVGENLGQFITAASTATKQSPFAAPALPFRLDVQVDKEGGLTRVISRDLTISETRGRLDLTIAQSGRQNHVTGTVAMGVLDFDKWLAATDWQPTGGATDPVAQGQGQTAVTGAIDITIEGFQVRNGLGQRIDAVVALDENGVSLSRASALLPGATNAAFSGKLSADGGQGTLLVEAGDISKFATWLGLAFPEGVPEGRLTTSDFKADFDFSGDAWTLSNIEGRLDNTTLSGEVGGGLGRSGPWLVRLVADQLNLDAYIPAGQEAQSSEKRPLSLPADKDVTFDIEIERLHLFEKNFTDTRVVGTLRSSKLSLSHMSSREGAGGLQLTGSVEQQAAGPVFDVSIQLNDWQAPVASHFATDLPEVLRALKVRAVDGTLTLVGAKSAMNMGLDIVSGDDLLSLSGVVGVTGNSLETLDVQGRFNHADLSGLLKYRQLADFRLLPAKGSLVIQKAAADDPTQIRVGGDAAGGNITADIIYGTRLEKLDLTFNHGNVGNLSETLGMTFTGLDDEASLRSEIAFDGAFYPENWSLTLENLKNGDVSIAGGIEVSAGNKVSGRAAIAGADITLMNTDQRSLGGGIPDALSSLAGYDGTISLTIENTRLAGQKLDFTSGQLVLRDGTLHLTSGEGGLINGEPLEANVVMALGEGYPYTGDLSGGKFDVAAFLKAEGKKPIVHTNTAVSLDFSGRLGDGLLSGLKASGSIYGGAGGLNFISVPGLVAEIETAQTGRSFLGNIGSLLRSGTTAVDNIESKFTLDSGVMLVESAKASGQWGEFSLDGQLNFLDEFMTLKGQLSLTNPPDTPAIPVSYQGSFDRPTAAWSSRLFERFVISIIERRLRATLFKELEEKTASSPEAGSNPGVAVFTRAFGLLTQLKREQDDKKKAQEAEDEQAVPKDGSQ